MDLNQDELDLEEELETVWFESGPPDDDEIEATNQSMLERQERFREAAGHVARAFAAISAVRKVALFGSVAKPLWKEVPRFREFRQAGIEVYHECKDVDLAVWLDDLSCLNMLRKANVRALKDLERPDAPGVAQHQVDVFILEPGTDRYLGRLCHFNQCPKDKPECRAPGCGARVLLRQHEEFVFDSKALQPGRVVLLYDQAGVPAKRVCAEMVEGRQTGNHERESGNSNSVMPRRKNKSKDRGMTFEEAMRMELDGVE
ncbi:MAG: nucleotidyltransferase domain-containing protein [Elusimicrobia bacterium]|nr:nucleotidyltransferase domain-containing protein [Elusimicrobiota bacterium]